MNIFEVSGVILIAISITQDEMLHLARLMRSVEIAAFPNALQAFLDNRLAFSTFVIVIYRVEQPPLPVYHWIPDPKLNAIYSSLYLNGSFLLDPFYQLSLNSFDQGAYRLRDVAPDRFFASEYYQQYYGATGLIDEIGFLTQISENTIGHLSISRSQRDRLFERREVQMLKAMAPVLSELLLRHCQWLEKQIPQDELPSKSHQLLDKVIKDYANDSLPGGLTKRESEIIALILQGHSSSSASMVLGIARETTKVHRRNIYRKLQISSQAELFATFSKALSTPL